MNAILSEKSTECKLEPTAYLVKKFENNFHCMVGPARAYFYVNGDREHEGVRVAYKTFAVIASEDTPLSRANLVDLIWDASFQPVVEELRELDPERLPEDNVLFWRKLPHFEPTDNGGVKLRMRLAIPGVRIPGEVQL